MIGINSEKHVSLFEGRGPREGDHAHLGSLRHGSRVSASAANYSADGGAVAGKPPNNVQG